MTYTFPSHAHSSKRRTAHFLFPLTLAGAALLAACSPAPAPDAEPTAPTMQGRQLQFPQGHPQLALLGVTAAAPGKTVTIDLPARLVWNEERTQRIYPAFAGRVVAILADVGQAVKPGSPLARIASPDFGIAQADTAKAHADVQMTQKTLQRQRELFDDGIAARKDLEQAETDAARARAEAARADARTKLYGPSGNVDQQLTLNATIGGVVVERNLNPGQEVRPDQSGPGVPALFIVSDPTSLWVQIDARESEAGTLKVGSVFTLTVPALGDEKVEGRVTATADAIDPATRTVRVRGVVANPDRHLKAEMLATAHIERTLGAGIVIPAQAVTLSGAQHSVFVQVQPGVFESRDVTLGYQGPKQVVVSRGLEVGDQVVSDNMLLLARQFRLAQDDAGPSARPDNTAAVPVASPAADKASAKAIP